MEEPYIVFGYLPKKDIFFRAFIDDFEYLEDVEMKASRKGWLCRTHVPESRLKELEEYFKKEVNYE